MNDHKYNFSMKSLSGLVYQINHNELHHDDSRLTPLKLAIFV